ncbi:MAG: hypothetical protein HOQ32_01105 [Lysobacter sp.]|nr:hypothetical protein [Lysobacter sp.]
MNLRSVFLNALARRVAYVIVALLLTALGIGSARAQGYCSGDNPFPEFVDNVPHADLTEAMAHCNSVNSGYSPSRRGQWEWTVFQGCQKLPGQNAVQGRGQIYGNHPTNGGGCTTSGQMEPYGSPHPYIPKDCSSASLIDGPLRAPTGSLDCRGECEYSYHPDSIDPSKVLTIGTPTGRSCDYQDYDCPAGYTPGGQLQSGPFSSNPQSGNCIPDPPDTCPEGQSMQDGECKPHETCPPGKVLNAQGICVNENNACPSGQTKAPDGSCTNNSCPDGQIKGADGTCKKDEDDDGEPDDDDGTFSGGDDCQNPPQCSGDAILCGQARIQWRIDCNTRKNRTISGGACSAVPICTGEKCDAMEYASLLQQWRTACATEALAAKAGQGGDMSGVHSRLDRIGKYLDGNGAEVPEAPAMPWEEGGGEEQDWSSGLGSGSCPAPISTSVSFLGTSQALDFSFGPLCDLASLLYPVVFAGGLLLSAYIVAGVRR